MKAISPVNQRVKEKSMRIIKVYIFSQM